MLVCRGTIIKKCKTISLNSVLQCNQGMPNTQNPSILVRGCLELYAYTTHTHTPNLKKELPGSDS